MLRSASLLPLLMRTTRTASALTPRLPPLFTSSASTCIALSSCWSCSAATSPPNTPLRSACSVASASSSTLCAAHVSRCSVPHSSPALSSCPASSRSVFYSIKAAVPYGRTHYCGTNLSHLISSSAATESAPVHTGTLLLNLVSFATPFHCLLISSHVRDTLARTYARTHARTHTCSLVAAGRWSLFLFYSFFRSLFCTFLPGRSVLIACSLYTHIRIHTHTRTQSNKHTNAHTQKHKHTHTHNTNKHTHTHTHTFNPPQCN
jgi:hypothetical protein